jgi:hypothetical protein
MVGAVADLVNSATGLNLAGVDPEASVIQTFSPKFDGVESNHNWPTIGVPGAPGLAEFSNNRIKFVLKVSP